MADPSKYFYVTQGMLTIDGVDDAEEMKLTDEAFDILGFTQVFFLKVEKKEIDCVRDFVGRENEFI